MGIVAEKMISDTADQIHNAEAKAAYVCRICTDLLTKLPASARAAALVQITHELGIVMQFVADEAAEQDNTELLKCTCGWQGKAALLVNGECPKCKGVA